MFALQKGSFKAFEEIYQLYSAKLYNYIYKISRGDRYLAEEIVQITFIRLWEMRESIDPDKSILFFLGTIAKHRMINMYQRQFVEYVYAEYLKNEKPPVENSTEKTADLRFLNEYIDALAEALPPSRKQIFILSKRKHYTNKEIAQVMNISESTVATQLALAMKFMREKMNRHYDKFISLLPVFLLINHK